MLVWQYVHLVEPMYSAGGIKLIFQGSFIDQNWIFSFEEAMMDPVIHSIFIKTVSSYPPVDLYLIFWELSLKNQVQQTGFFVNFELDFCRLHRQ